MQEQDRICSLMGRHEIHAEFPEAAPGYLASITSDVYITIRLCVPGTYLRKTYRIAPAESTVATNGSRSVAHPQFGGRQRHEQKPNQLR